MAGRAGLRRMTAAPLKISVVIPCFNAQRYIGAAIESALAQHWPELEIVVVDDGSTDNSVALVREAYPNVVVLRQQRQGVALARNRGIAHAHGDWIAFLDADDLWLPGKLQAQADLLRATPQARMAYTAWQVWSSTEAVPSPDYLANLQARAGQVALWSEPSGWIYPQLLLDCVVWTSSVLVQRSVLDEVGLFDPQLRIGEDYDLWLRASRVTPIVCVPRPYALYRMHPNSITRSAPDKNYRSVVIKRALARWGYDSPDGQSARKAEVDRALARSWSDFASAHLALGQLPNALEAALMALRTDIWHSGGWRMLAKTLAHSLTNSRVPQARL